MKMKRKGIYIIICCLLSAEPSVLSAQTSSCNYVLERTILDSIGRHTTQITYYDEWGRPELTVSNALNASGNYLKTLQEYDAAGRPFRTWLPVLQYGSDYRTPAQVAQLSYFCYEDSRAYSETGYDAFNEKTKETAPGAGYTGHPTVYRRKVATGNNVRKYAVAADGQLVQEGMYTGGKLTYEETVDADGHTSRVYSDISGRKILERRVAGSNIDTYYVYDDMGRLRFVLPPMCNSASDIDMYGYVYTYDDKGRMATKKLPGCEVQEYHYNSIDRLSLYRDGLLRSGNLYRFFLYDRLGRPAVQGTTSTGVFGSNGTVVYDGTVPGIQGTGYHFINADNTVQLADCTIETVNYYDDGTYGFLNLFASGTIGPATDSLHLNSSQSSHKTRLTGTWQRASNGNPLLSTFCYDDYGRMSAKAETGLDGMLTISRYTYNYWGGMTKEDINYYYYDEDEEEYLTAVRAETINKYDNPHTKLLTSSLLIIKGMGEMNSDTIILHRPTYDDFGHMEENDRSGTAGDMVYTYDNLHGRLKKIESAGGFVQNLYHEDSDINPRYNGSISAMSWRTNDNIRRTYHYDYDGLNRLVTAEYSSSYGEWTSAPTQELRALIPMYQSIGDDYSTYYEYDRNSNIERIERFGTSDRCAGGEIDDLFLLYNGNRVVSVYENSVEQLTYSGAFDYQGFNGTFYYSYDANGNLTEDDSKEISNIEYDHLGNPRRISFYGQNSTEYVYAPDGRKLRTSHVRRITTGGSVTVMTRNTNYIGNCVFNGCIPSMFRFDGGYCTFDNQGMKNGVHYYVQDYQGNNRMVVNAQTNAVEQVLHYYPYGSLMGDISTNQSLQSYMYSGKELDRTYGLDLYDFHARQQDPILGRFTKPDQKSEDYYGISPYTYCAGDPVNCVDPTGKYIIGKDGKKVTYSNGKISDNALPDTKRVGEAMCKTRVGRKRFKKLLNANFPITITIEDSKEERPDLNGVSVILYDIDRKSVTKADIFIYEKSIKDKITNKREQGITTLDLEDYLGATAVHEATHVTSPTANRIGYPNGDKFDKSMRESSADFDKQKHIDEIIFNSNTTPKQKDYLVPIFPYPPFK